MTKEDLNLRGSRSRKWAVECLVNSIGGASVSLLLGTSLLAAEPQPLKITHLSEWPGYERLGDNNIPAARIAMSGTIGYVYVGGAILVVDFSNPERPVLLQRVPSEASSLGISGSYLYETGRNGFRILDISNPAIALPLGSVPTPTAAARVALSERFAYMNAAMSGLYVINIEDPANPLVVGRLERSFGGPMALAGDYMFLKTWGQTAFDIINVTDAANPMFVKTVTLDPTRSSSLAMAVEGNYAYLASLALTIFDITDPTNPVALSEISIPELGPNDWAWDIQVHNGRAYVSTPRGLHLFDISDSSNPIYLGRYSDIIARSTWIQGDVVYIAANVRGVEVVDFADPANPRLLGSYETSGYTQGVAFSQGHAFLAETSVGLRAIDVSNPQQPKLVDTLGVAGSHIAVVGDYAYLPGSNLSGVSISDPANLVRAGTAGAVGGLLRSSGNYLYLPFSDSRCSTGEHPCFPLLYQGGFYLYDIGSFPGNPQLEGRFSIPETVADVRAWDLAVAEPYAYVAHTDRLAVVDISDPKAPVRLSELPLGCWRIAALGDYAYVAGPIPYVQTPPPQTLSVIDIRDKFGPTKVGQIATGRIVNTLLVSGQHLYVSSSNLVEVFDLSDPENPVSVGSTATKGEGLDLAVEGNLIYVADGLWGLQIFQVEPLVRLEAELAGTELRLRWAADARNYILQSTLTLTDRQWEPVGAAPQVQDRFNVVKLPANSPTAFFRLIQP